MEKRYSLKIFFNNLLKGNWENGTKIFLDPLLPSQRFILIQVNLIKHFLIFIL